MRRRRYLQGIGVLILCSWAIIVYLNTVKKEHNVGEINLTYKLAVSPSFPPQNDLETRETQEAQEAQETIAFLKSSDGLTRSSPVAPGHWQVTVAEDGTPRLLYDGQLFADASFVFWGRDWEWAQAHVRRLSSADAIYTLVGEIPKLGITFEGHIKNDSPNVLRYDIKLTVPTSLGKIVGGGVEFHLGKFVDLGQKENVNAELLPGNRGWRWTPWNNETVVCEASPPFLQCYFEQQDRQIVRCFFIGSETSVDVHHFSMVLTFPPGTVLVPGANDRYSKVNTAEWYRNALKPHGFPVDFSFLNDPPAGRHGFLRVDKDAFVFEDGTPARFWGCNLAAYAIFSDRIEIERHAARIAMMGFNLVRIHHHDSHTWVSPSVIDKTRSDTQYLDERGMDSLDYWIKCLKDHGVYVWLDLHVGRTLKKGDKHTVLGEIAGFEEIERQDGRLSGFCYFNSMLRELMKDFNEKYLTHVNPYTGLAYKDDPAIALLLITNENDLTQHFGNLMLADKKNPVHRKVFLSKLAEFCQETGLDPSQAEKTWIPGPSKFFLAQIEHDFYQELAGHLKKLGVKVPTTLTSMWGEMPAFSLPSLASGDFVDVHTYGGPEQLSQNPRFAPNFISWIAAAQVVNKPLTVSEWNVPYPTVDRFIAPMYVAVVGAFQGWDALLLYNYSQDGLSPNGRLTEWSTFLDPSLSGVMPVAALLYRLSHVRPAGEIWTLILGPEEVFSRRLDPRNTRIPREIPETHGLQVLLPDTRELAWDTWDVSSVPSKSFKLQDDVSSEHSDGFLVADTGEFQRDWRHGRFCVNTAKTQAVIGWFDAEEIHLKDVSLQLDTRKAAIILSSLDDMPIKESRRLLLTAVARSVMDDTSSDFYSEPVSGIVKLRANPGLTLYPLTGDGTRMQPIDAPYDGERYDLVLNSHSGSHWFLLE